MIIQCRTCDTRYRFDETLISGEGAWVRCSRCRAIFFQENPSGAPDSSVPGARDAAPPAPARETLSGGAAMPPDPSPRREAVPGGGAQGMTQERPAAGGFAASAPERDRDAAALPRDAAGENETEEMDDPLRDEEDLREEWEEQPPPKRGRAAMFLRIFGGVFAVILLGAALLFWLVPESGPDALRALSQRAPEWARLVGIEAPPPEPPARSIRFTDLRQRFFESPVLGNLRVVEGTAVNGAAFAVRGIMVKAELTDGQGRVLAERISFGGNTLTDEELGTLTAEEIQRETTLPLGSDVTYDRIPPQGQLPFMIVFIREPAGAVKALVSPAGAEKAGP